MRPLIVFNDVTVDGFMAGPDNDLGFVVDDPKLEDELTGELAGGASAWLSCWTNWTRSVRSSWNDAPRSR